MSKYIGATAVNLSTTSADVTGNATIGGNLTVKGTTVTIDSATAQTVDLGDNDKIRLGDGDDLQIYHDGSNSNIKDTGTGPLKIFATDLYVNNAAGNKTHLSGIDGGAVTLFNNGAAKLATTSSGVEIDGIGMMDSARLSSNSGTSYWDIRRDTSTGHFVIKDDGLGDVLTIKQDSGNVGIGTSPSVPFHVNGGTENIVAKFESSDADALIQLADNATSDTVLFGVTSDDLLFRCDPGNIIFKINNNTEGMRLTSDGDLLIGNTSTGLTSDGINLHSDGTLEVRRNISTANSSTVGYISRGSSDGNLLNFYRDTTHVGSMIASSSDFHIDATDDLVLKAGGNSGLGIFQSGGSLQNVSVYADLLPTGTLDLGSSGARFEHLYLSGGVNFGDAGGSGSSSSNSLDSYEEGTWTPTLARWTGGNINAIYTAQNGRYTKIGRMVTLSFDITVSSINSQGSSIAYINGAPFNNPSSQDYDYAGTFGIRTCIPEATIATSCIKHSTNTAILVRQNNDFDQNVDDNWQSGSIRGSITYEHG